MKYKVKKVGDFESTIQIDVDFEDLESKKDEAISKISKSLKVKGFSCLLYTSPSPRDRG